MCINSREIVQRKAFLYLERERLVNLLKCEEIIVKSEEQVYESVLAWIQFDSSSRQQYLDELMAIVRFPMMPREYLVSRVETDPLFQDNPQCKDFISEAIEYHNFLGHLKLSVASRTQPRLHRREYLLVVGGLSNELVELYDLRDGRPHLGNGLRNKSGLWYVTSCLSVHELNNNFHCILFWCAYLNF